MENTEPIAGGVQIDVAEQQMVLNG